MKKKNIEAIYPLSPMQQGMLFHTLYSPESGVYFEQLRWVFHGEIDSCALKKAWEKILERHSILRTGFVWEKVEKPHQIVYSQLTLPWTEHDWRGIPEDEHKKRLETFFREDQERGFKLGQPPLMRCALIRLTDESYQFVWSFHHLLLDGWSLGIVLKEVFSMYEVICRGEEPVLSPTRPYQEYIAWLGTQDTSQAETFWRQELKGFTEPTALISGRLSTQKERYEEQEIEIPESTTAELNALARTHRITMNTLLQGAWALLLGHYSGSDDVLFGATVSGRPPVLPGVQSIVGVFINTLPVRVHVSQEASLIPWLQELHARHIRRDQYAYSSLVDIQRWSKVPHGLPLFESIVVFENYVVDESLGKRDLEIRDFYAVERSNYPLDIIAIPGSKLLLRFAYDSSRLSTDMITRMAGHLQTLLKGMADNPNQTLSQLSWLTTPEQKQLLVEWNATGKEYPRDKCIHQLFEEQAERTPDAVAVTFEEKTLTYRQLNQRANQLAHYMQASGVRSEVLVGICAERSLEMVVGLLAILKAGGAYVPLDPLYPAERLKFMLEETCTPLLLTQQGLLDQLSGYRGKVVHLDTDWNDISQESIENLTCITTSENLAYVMYTSGSTGKPKGVSIIHRNVVRLVKNTNYINLTEDEVFLQLAPISFDASTLELWGPLLNGGRLVVMPPATPSLEELGEALKKYRITTLWLTAGLFHLMVDERPDDLKHLRQLLAGGDVLSLPHVRATLRNLENGRLINGYGPTENTTFTCCHVMEKAEAFNEGLSSVPIGRPINNTQVYVLDCDLNPVPVGVQGELYIGGDGLARDYFKSPDITADKFIPNPYGKEGSRLYRTGDLVRYLPDGNIEFIGRVDNQVKIRGFRIELGEIDVVLGKHPAVKEVVVVARKDKSGEKQLVAYVVPKEQDSQLQASLRRFLKDKLPDYMVPGIFMILDAFPLDPNGKVDRRALPAPDASQTLLQAGFAPPGTPMEEILATIWAEVFERERVSVHDNFFELGGHSLLAVQMIAKIRSRLQVELPLQTLFEKPTVAGIARCIQGMSTQLPEITPVKRESDTFVLSFAQQRLWFLDQFSPGNTAYNISLVIRLKGPLDRKALDRTLREIVRRHETLRTTFKTVDGEPMQVIHTEISLDIPVVDLETLSKTEQENRVRELAREASLKPFSLSKGPLLRVTLFALDREDHILLVSMHHVLSDGWSIQVFKKEMSTLYNAFSAGETPSLPGLAIQYVDFAYWQREWLKGDVLEEQLSYWKETLAGLPVLALPTDRPRPVIQTYRGSDYSFNLSKELTVSLQRLSNKEGVTLFMTILAAFKTLLYRYTGQEDIAVGVPVANRNITEIEELIGFFVNTLVMRTDLSGQLGFLDVLKRVRKVALGAYSHQELPFEKLVDELQPERDMSRNPLFQVAFQLLKTDMEHIELSNLTSSFMTFENERSKFDLELDMFEGSNGISGLFTYNTDLFDRSTIARMAEHLKCLLESVVIDPKKQIATLDMLTQAEKQQILVQWNDTRKDYPENTCIHQLIEAQVERTPEAVALVFEDTKLSYKELNKQANKLAHYLRKQGVGPDVPVGICMERSIEMVVSILGVLKAGGAYMPLDPEYPKERLSFMLEDARIPVLLCQKRLIDVLPEHGATVICPDTNHLDGEASAELYSKLISQESDENPVLNTTSDNLAYVIYTSGSTGKPKGAMNVHRGLCNRLLWMQDTYHLTADDHVLQKTPFSFDVSVWEFLWPLLTGASLVVAKPGGHRDSAYLVELIAGQKITVIHFVPSMLQIFVEEPGLERCAFLRQVICSGEALPFELQQRFFERIDCRLDNLYGPTEASIDVSFWHCERDGNLQTVPIGRPIANTQLYILDNHLQPVPVGVSGELYIGGVGLARGYLNRPELTKEKFIPDPFSGRLGDRLYKTGDLSRYLPDGTILFMGRIDGQVKIRGFRVELGEIESVLLQHPEIKASVVMLRADRLVAYIVPKEKHMPQYSELTGFLKHQLPEYMVPSTFVQLDQLPLNANGKVDRKALPEPDQKRPELRDVLIPPRSHVETILADIWAELLGIEQVGIHDNFFELGGHSLLVAQLVARVRSRLQVELPLQIVFEEPTIAGIAKNIDRESSPLPNITPIKREENTFPLSFAQLRLWFLDQLVPENAFYNMPMAIELTGPLNTEAMVHTLDEIVRRHETLRTSFKTVDGEPMQEIHPQISISLPVVDLKTLSAVQQDRKVKELIREEALKPFNLSTVPLLRVTLLSLAEERHMLLVTMHHILSDAWSVQQVFLRELAMLYESFCSGEPQPLPDLPIQYVDFVHWQREWLKGEVLEEHLSYWKERLADLPVLDLPLDHPRPAFQSFKGASYPFNLSKELTSSLRKLSNKADATMFMTLLAAFQTLLSRYTGQEDIPIGIPSANRNSEEIERLIGLFVNALVMRTDMSGRPSFRELIRRVREVALGVYSHQHFPFEKLVDELKPERSLSQNPLFQVVFQLLQGEEQNIVLSNLKFSQPELEFETVRFDLELHLWERTEGTVNGFFLYNTDIFDKPTIARMAGHLQMLLTSVAEDPDRPITDIEILTEAERQQIIVQWNDTRTDYPGDKCFHKLFEAHADRTPNAPAAVFEDNLLTYRELNQKANQLAHRLQALGVGPEVMVGICMERSMDMIVALLGILKAGGAYVPIDPTYPRERLAFILNDSRVSILLTQQKVIEGLPEHKATDICLDTGWQIISMESNENPSSHVTPDNLAYVIYTSGSTGIPKGVMLQHRGLCNLAETQVRAFHTSQDNRVIQFFSLSFDGSIFEIAMALRAGATLYLGTSQSLQPGPPLVKTLRDNRITNITISPSALAALSNEDIPDLKTIITAGEACTSELVSRWAHGRSFFNAYGPTEVTVWNTVTKCTDGSQTPPIGRPIANTQAYLLDQYLNPVPVGVPGELHVGGSGLARCYLNRPELTAERFIPNPFSDEPGSRLYKTGDLARYRHDGEIEFLGRIDYQVKIRGFRIELGEIESVLEQHPALQKAIALAREDRPGEKRLVAYAVPKSEALQQGGEWNAEYVSRWQKLYQETYGKPPVHDDPKFNTIGWNSSYTGLPIPEDQMREWVNQTVMRILALHPESVMEIGCGTGLLLSRVAPRCARYLGSDFSQEALDHVEKLKKSEKGLENVTLFNRTADDFGGIEKESFDTIVLNSVVQYFPDVQYLLKVMEGCVRAVKPGGAIFVGDVRHLPLLSAYHASVQLEHAPSSLSRMLLQERVQKHVREEEELVIDPGFFIALKRHLPEITHVQIQPKRGHYSNELSRFRYDVTLYVGHKSPCDTVSNWIDWQNEKLTLTTLYKLLEGCPEVLGLRNVPNGRVESENRILYWLSNAPDSDTVEHLRQTLSKSPKEGVDPEELWKIGDELPYCVEVSLANSSADGSYDVVFMRRIPEAAETALVSFNEPREIKPWSQYANIPMERHLKRKLVPELRKFLKDRLPDYMMPAAFVILDTLPLNTSGKVDRRLLPAPDMSRSDLQANFVPPRTPTEEILVNIWADVLGTSQVGIHDNFFELGGHSLLAVQLVSRVRRQLQVELPLQKIFEEPTVAGIAKDIHRKSTPLPEIKPLKRDSDTFELSFAQQRLWFLDQFSPGNTAYNIPLVLRLAGSLDKTALEKSLNKIVQRHEALRTTFKTVDGEPRQVIHPELSLKLQVVDLKNLKKDEQESQTSQLVGKDAMAPFDLSEGPLIRVSLYALGKDDHILLVTMHHILSDAWSIQAFMQELVILYEAFSSGETPSLPDLPVQYIDYAYWQREWLKGDVLEEQISYWKDRLSGSLPALELPTDRPRPAVQTYRGTAYQFSLSRELTDSLQRLSNKEGVTLFMTMLAAFKALLYRYTGQEDIAVGVPVANRGSVEIERLIGFFVNTLVMRTNLSDQPDFTEVLRRVREVAVGAYSHQELPFERLVDELQPERDMSRNPLFQVAFQLLKGDLQHIGLSNLTLNMMGVENETSKFDLELNLFEGAEGINGAFTYNTDLFDFSTIARMAGHFERLLQSVVRDPEKHISEIEMLTEEEKRQILVKWNDTKVDYPENACIHQLIEAQVERMPENIALVFEDTSLSYGELNKRANSLAHYLRKRGVGPDVAVGIFMERSIEMVVSILAILKAGGAYLPLDPEYPKERLAFMLEDAKTPVILCQKRLIDLLPEHGATVICPDSDWELMAQESESNPGLETTGKNLAYVIYTSGSTGKPKGAMNIHRGLCNRLTWMQDTYRLTSEDRVLQKTPFSFDVSVWEFLWPLFTGASLVVAKPKGHRDNIYLVDIIAGQKITVVHFVPSMLQLFIEESGVERCSCLRQVICSGEALPFELQQRFFERMNCSLDNLYGPTEASIDVSFWHCEREGKLQTVPIGKPIANTQLYILDAHLQPVPVGVPGELHIGGVGLARGYLNRPELTKEKFIPDPFKENPDDRMYKTGDLARYLPDGTILFMGRIDGQVKIRGFRVELGEIESVLLQHPKVKAATVTYSKNRPGKELVAYLVANDKHLPEHSELRHFLKDKLPEYMVPSAFVQLDRLPLNPNGKVDRKALPEPEGFRPDLASTYIPPRSDTEQRIADIWKEVLHIDKPGINDNFFELGGHSLLMVQVRIQLNKIFGKELSMVEMFEYPTIGSMSEHLTPKKSEETFSDVQGRAKQQKDAINRQRQRMKEAADQQKGFTDKEGEDENPKSLEDRI